MKVSRFLKISRPGPWWLFFMGAYLLGAGNIKNLSPLSWVELFFMIPLAFFVNGLNDVYDRESDKINPRKTKEGAEGIVLKDEEVPTVLRWAAFFAILFLAVSILSLNFFHIVLSFLFVSLSFAYSHKWFRLRDIPFLDSFIGGSMLCLWPALIALSLNSSVFSVLSLKMLWVVLPFMSFHAIAASEDAGPDKTAGMNSVAIFLGKKWVKIFAIFLIGISTLFAISLQDLFLISVLLINLLNFFSLTLLKEEDQPRLVLASFVTSWLIVLAYYLLRENIYIMESISKLISF